jgi:hypothetical protein
MSERLGFLVLVVVVGSGCYTAPLTRPVQTVLDAHEVGGESVRVSLVREPDGASPAMPTLDTLLAAPLDARRAVEVALVASPRHPG